jgi:hypothetical protein
MNKSKLLSTVAHDHFHLRSTPERADREPASGGQPPEWRIIRGDVSDADPMSEASAADVAPEGYDAFATAEACAAFGEAAIDELLDEHDRRMAEQHIEPECVTVKLDGDGKLIFNWMIEAIDDIVDLERRLRGAFSSFEIKDRRDGSLRVTVRAFDAIQDGSSVEGRP